MAAKTTYKRQQTRQKIDFNNKTVGDILNKLQYNLFVNKIVIK